MDIAFIYDTLTLDCLHRRCNQGYDRALSKIMQKSYKISLYAV